MNKDIRICFVGDSLVNGTGDTSALGWTGRVCAMANRYGFVVTGYNLGVRRNTSADILARWRDEVERRRAEQADNRLVFSFGVNDTNEENGSIRIQHNDTLGYARRILDDALEFGPLVLIGPTPVLDSSQNERIEKLSTALSELAQELDVPYLSVFHDLISHGKWMDELRNGDGSHPDTGGYAQLASLIMQWPKWWFYDAGTQGLEM